MSWIWSYLLTAVGLVGLWFTIRKNPVGFLIAVGAQILWVTYAVVTHQWGFIVSAAAYGSFNLVGWLRWRREERTRDEDLRVPRR